MFIIDFGLFISFVIGYFLFDYIGKNKIVEIKFVQFNQADVVFHCLRCHCESNSQLILKQNSILKKFINCKSLQFIMKKDVCKNIPDNVVNKKLYCQVKKEIIKKVDVYPSAYANGLLVKEYKKRGGKYRGKKDGKSGLDRWFKEKWVNVCETDKKGNYKTCGRKTANNLKKYPYCRPSKRISKKTPMTAKELVKKYGKQKIKEMCKDKRKFGLPQEGSPRRVSIQ